MSHKLRFYKSILPFSIVLGNVAILTPKATVIKQVIRWLQVKKLNPIGYCVVWLCEYISKFIQWRPTITEIALGRNTRLHLRHKATLKKHALESEVNASAWDTVLHGGQYKTYILENMKLIRGNKQFILMSDNLTLNDMDKNPPLTDKEFDEICEGANLEVTEIGGEFETRDEQAND